MTQRPPRKADQAAEGYHDGQQSRCCHQSHVSLGDGTRNDHVHAQFEGDQEGYAE